MLKRWIEAPLLDIDKINERLVCVSDLLDNMDIVLSLY